MGPSDFGPNDAVDACIRPGCNQRPGDGGIIAGMVETCEDACASYCDAFTTACEPNPCFTDHCVRSCVDRRITAEAIQSEVQRLQNELCGAENGLGASENLGLSCTYLCEDLDAFLSNTDTNTCGNLLACGERCTSICESNPIEMVQNFRNCR